MSLKLQEALAVLTVLTVLVGVPAAIHGYESSRIADLGEEVQVITLTGISDGGTWTTEPVAGHNYWRRDFEPLTELVIDPTRPVVLRVRSADVLHSFSIPALRIRPIDVYPGHEILVRLEPEDLEGEEELGFLCYQFCGSEHAEMSGTLYVDFEPGDEPVRPVGVGGGGS